MKLKLMSKMEFIDKTQKKRKKYSSGSISKTGKKVASNAEKVIADYLDQLGIPYIKPRKASKGQYYKNYAFVPDFIIDGVVIEYFGIKGDKNYDKNNRLKEKSKYPNKKYIFLKRLDERGSLCTRFKYLIGKNPQTNLKKVFDDANKEKEEFRNLMKRFYNKEINSKIMKKFYSECSKELKQTHTEIFSKFIEHKGKKYLRELLLAARNKFDQK